MSLRLSGLPFTDRLAALAGVLTALLGATAIVARIVALRIPPPGAFPVATWVSILTVLMGIALVAGVLVPDHRRARAGLIATGTIVIACGLLAFAQHVLGLQFDLDSLFSTLPAGFHSTGPLGWPTLLCIGAGLVALVHRREKAGIPGVVPLILGSVASIGLLYHAPLVPGPGWRPVSLVAALGSITMGSGLIAAAGPAAWPLRMVAGSSVRAMLLRWFLPMTILCVIGTDLLTVNLFSRFSPALGSVLNALASMGIAAIVTYYVARTIGGRLDRAEEAERRMTQLYTVLSQVNHLITRAETADLLFQGACRISVASGGLSLAWIGELDQVARRVKPVARFGNSSEELDRLVVSLDDVPEGRGPTGTAARKGTLFISRDVQNDPRMRRWKDITMAHGLHAIAALPLRTHDVVTHTISLLATDPLWFTEAHLALLEEMASDLSFAMTTLATRAEHDLAQRTIVESENRFRSLIENSSDLITIVDADGTIRYQSPSHTLLFGYEAGERLGKNTLDLVHPDDRSQLEKMLRDRKARDGEMGGALVTCRMRHKSGAWRVIESAAWGMLGVPGVAGIVVRSRDITERQALESALRQSQKMEIVGQMASGIAHDFNNMLSIISMNAELAASSVPEGEAEIHEELRDVQTAAEHGRAMVKQLMGLARQGELDLQPSKTSEVVARAAKMARRLLTPAVILEADIPDDLPSIMADVVSVEQMILNLVTNARDAMPSGGTLRISASVARGNGAGDQVRVAVADTGTGMDAETLAKIFEPFFTTKPAGQGTGLGMAMVHGLMKQHGGSVAIDSTPGKGTTMTLSFHALAPGGVRRSGETRKGGEIILVVDDEPSLRRATRRILQRNGYRVLVAEDGEAALRILREQPVQLVFSDLQMPGLGGVGLYEAVKRDFSGTRFILGSGQGAGGPDGAPLPDTIPLINKPWTSEQLLSGIRQALDA